jgi:toxin HigB-1
MIATFRHKGLRRFFEHDDGSKLSANMLRRIRQILTTLEAAQTIEGVRQPLFKLHPLKGDLKGFWALTVHANWRIIFRFENGKAFDVDLVDYH